MFHPDDDALADLALGEPVNPSVRDHASSCPVCATEVESLSRALAVLRTAPVELLAPPPRVWDAVRSAVLLDDAPAPVQVAAPAVAIRDTDPPADPYPPAIELGSRRDSQASPRSRRTVGFGWLAAAAAVGVIGGGVGVAALDRSDSPTEPASVVLASARLDTLDTKSAKGSAELVRTGASTDLSVRTEPIDAGPGYVEVWLINRDLKRMVSVGVLAPGASSQTFTVPQTLVDDGYVVVDISREPLDGDSTHSGDSVVRGALGV
ncbi:MAG: anti-sigma factor domain-containing protein [Dermatophilaceae bacterium]